MAKVDKAFKPILDYILEKKIFSYDDLITKFGKKEQGLYRILAILEARSVFSDNPFQIIKLDRRTMKLEELTNV